MSSGTMIPVAILALSTWLAEDEPKIDHLVEARLGVGSLSLRDDSLTPYAFTGPKAEIFGSYALGVGRNLVELDFDLGAAGLWTRAGDPGLGVQYAVAVSYGRALRLPEAHALWLGPSIRAAHELAVLDSWDDTHGYWLDDCLVGPSARYGLRLHRRHALEMRAELGLFGVASRPPPRRLNKQDATSQVRYHFDRLGESPKLVVIGKVTQARLELAWRIRRKPHFGSGFALGAQTRLSHAMFPASYVSWYGGLFVGWGWSLQ